MRSTMRFFLLDEAHIIALPPDAGDCFSVWVHGSDNSIMRCELKPEALPTLVELTEEDARQADPVMFRECLDAPYAGAPTLMAFYLQRYKEEMEYIRENTLNVDSGQ